MIRIAQSSSRHVISVSGQGNEPKLEFSSTLIEFGPVLPHSSGDEKEVIIRNPSSFSVEIYSLEFDKQYLEEEKVYGSSDFMLFFSRPFPSLLFAIKNDSIFFVSSLTTQQFNSHTSRKRCFGQLGLSGLLF